MQATVSSPRMSVTRRWTARALSGLFVLFMLFDGLIHLSRPVPVVDAFARLGYPISTSVGIGVVELLCTLLYLIPRTALLGAILLTGILGGAMAAHVRVGDPFFDTFIFPVMVGALLWGGLILRDERLRALLLPGDRRSNSY